MPDKAQSSAAKRCPGCGDTLHWLGAGYGHDKDNMACCVTLYEMGRGLHTASELLDRWDDAVKAAERADTPLAERAVLAQRGLTDE